MLHDRYKLACVTWRMYWSERNLFSTRMWLERLGECKTTNVTVCHAALTNEKQVTREQTTQHSGYHLSAAVSISLFHIHRINWPSNFEASSFPKYGSTSVLVTSTVVGPWTVMVSFAPVLRPAFGQKIHNHTSSNENLLRTPNSQQPEGRRSISSHLSLIAAITNF